MRCKHDMIEGTCSLCLGLRQDNGTHQTKGFKSRKVYIQELESQFQIDHDLGKLNNSLPKMPWFRKMLNIYYPEKGAFDEEHENTHKGWTVEETEKLSKIYYVIGESYPDSWHHIADTEFKRSIAAIEHQLRFMDCSPEIYQLILELRTK
jgi:hypothetical protein